MKIKIKDIVNIIQKNDELTQEIVRYRHKLNSLNFLDINGNLIEFVAKQKTLEELEANTLTKPLLDNDRKIIKYNKPKLEQAIKEYKDWLEQEI